MKKYLLISISILILIALSAGGYMWWKKNKYNSSIKKFDIPSINFIFDYPENNNWLLDLENISKDNGDFEGEIIYKMYYKNKIVTESINNGDLVDMPILDRITDIPVNITISPISKFTRNEDGSINVISPPPSSDNDSLFKLNNNKVKYYQEKKSITFYGSSFNKNYNVIISVNIPEDIDQQSKVFIKDFYMIVSKSFKFR